MKPTPSGNPRPALHPHYRPDIDGLRAVAVMLVMAFHAFPDRLKGGFVGVDIFFVISGYLISTILFKSLDAGKFSLADFYVRRIRRIIPALLVVLASCFVAGWFLLLADEYQQLGKHMAGGMAFISNLVLMTEVGYFDNASETKPLLHLWSLGIEEQFYLVWPLILMAGWKYPRILAGSVIALAGFSFAANIAMVHGSPGAAFYLPLPRFWELLAGTAIAYVTQYRPELLDRGGWVGREERSIAGLALLLAGVVLLNPYRAFPGWWAILPVAGAVLLISAGPDAVVNRSLLSHRWLVWIGLLSFPLYLWHWPLLTFLRIVKGGGPDLSSIWAAVGATFVLAWITWRYLEIPIRRSRRESLVTPFLLVSMVAVAGVGLWTADNHGFEGYAIRSSDKNAISVYYENSAPGFKYFNTINRAKINRDDCNFRHGSNSPGSTGSESATIAADCYTPKPGLKTVFLWGDSHVQHLYQGLRDSLSPDWNVLIVGTSGCLPGISVDEMPGEGCTHSNTFALERIQKIRPDVVLVAQNYGHSYPRMKMLAAYLHERGVGRVLFAGPTPHWKSDLPRNLQRNLWNTKPARTFLGLDTSFMQLDEKLRKNFVAENNPEYFSIIEHLCNQNGCLVRIGDDVVKGLTSWDYGHLTPVASNYIGPALARKVMGSPD